MIPSSADQWNAWAQADMFERRVVFVTGELDDLAAANLCAQLMMLDADGDEAVHMQVNGAGGTLTGALALIDTIELLGVPVEATCVGRADGPAMFVLATCPRRIVAPRASLRLAEPSAGDRTGGSTDLAGWAEQVRSQRADIVDRIALRSGRPAEEIDAALRRGTFYAPEEAVAAGLADEVAAPSAQVLRFPRKVGFSPR